MIRPRQSNPDHARRHNMPAPSSEVIEAHLGNLLSPRSRKARAYCHGCYRNPYSTSEKKAKTVLFG